MRVLVRGGTRFSKEIEHDKKHSRSEELQCKPAYSFAFILQLMNSVRTNRASSAGLVAEMVRRRTPGAAGSFHRAH